MRLPSPLSFVRLLVAFASLTIALMSPGLFPGAPRPYTVLAASPTPRAAATGSISSTAIIMANGTMQVLSAPSGVTTARLVVQIRSGVRLVVRVRTAPRALVTLTVTFADGSAIEKRQRANAAGAAVFAPLIAYQPQGGPEAATIVVTARLPRVGLNDTIQGSVTVLPHLVLTGRIAAPYALVVGHTLLLRVVSNQPNATVRLTLRYPDGALEPYTGYTDAMGLLPLSLVVSPLHGVGALHIDAALSFGGVQRRLTPVVVHLRRAG